MTGYEGAPQAAGALETRLAGITFPLSRDDETDICVRVFKYADELKSLGMPPERVIVAVKRVADAAGIRSTRRIAWRGEPLAGRDKLLVDMVVWCIEGYYTHAGG
jgi:hypothetical protein